MNTCMSCSKNKLLFWCVVGNSTLAVCLECAVKFGYKIIEEVKEVESDNSEVEAGGSRERLS
jgi:ribosome-binding protein aMBF1 (putative translation factor)